MGFKPWLPNLFSRMLAVSLFASASALAAEKQTFEAEDAKRVGGASKVADSTASGGCLVGLTKPGQGVKFTKLPSAGKLAIRYASTNVGTISVAVNERAGAQGECSFLGRAHQFFSQCDH